MQVNSKVVIKETNMPALVREIDKNNMAQLLTYERKPIIVPVSLLRLMHNYEKPWQNFLPGTKVLAKEQSKIIRLIKENS